MEQKEELKKYNRIYREMDEIYHRAAMRRGLSDSAFCILYAICEWGDGCLQRDISKSFCLSKQTIHSSIRKLEQEGYLTMKPGTGRNMHIYMTPAGKKIMEEKIGPVIQAENEVFDSMTAAEGRELLRLSEKYMELFKEKLEGIESTNNEKA